MDILDDGSAFYECIIKRRLTVKEVFIRAGIILLGVIVIYAGLLFRLGMLGIIVGGWFSYFFVSNRRIEYEYALKGNVLDIYRIIAKSRRRKMIPLELTRLDKFGPVDDREYNHQINIKTKVLDFTTKEKANRKNMYYAVVTRPKRKYMVIIEPDDRILEQMNLYIPKYL